MFHFACSCWGKWSFLEQNISLPSAQKKDVKWVESVLHVKEVMMWAVIILGKMILPASLTAGYFGGLSFWLSLILGLQSRVCWGAAGLSWQLCSVWSWECRAKGQRPFPVGSWAVQEGRPGWDPVLPSDHPLFLQWTQRRTARTRLWKEEPWQIWVKPLHPHPAPQQKKLLAAML